MSYMVLYISERRVFSEMGPRAGFMLDLASLTSIYSKFHMIWTNCRELVFRFSWQLFKELCFYLTILFVSFFVDIYTSPFISVSVACIVMRLWTALNPVYTILSWLQCHCLAHIGIHIRIQPTTTYYILPNTLLMFCHTRQGGHRSPFTLSLNCLNRQHIKADILRLSIYKRYFSANIFWKSVCILHQCLLAFMHDDQMTINNIR